MFVEPLLDSLKNVLVLPASDPALLARGAVMLDGASLAGIGPVAAQAQSLFLVGIVVDQAFTGRADVNILGCHVDKVLLAKPTLGVNA